MNTSTALVTGAAGFLGRRVVRALCNAGYCVRAAVHRDDDRRLYDTTQGIEATTLDVLDRKNTLAAMSGIDVVYHLAALLDTHGGRARMYEVNVEGTRNVWECAAASGVKKALYCSTTAVYGLLSRSERIITEDVPARAIEPYGNTKLLAERAALGIAARTGLHTTIVRPVAIFGPGEHTPFGRKLRHAAISKLLIAGGFQNKRFSFVHVEDVANAAVHLMSVDCPSGEIFNIAVNDPIGFEDAFSAYVRVLRQAGKSYAKVRLFAGISTLLHENPAFLHRLWGVLGDRFMFKIWRPGFDLLYSSSKLLGTSFRFMWDDFEKVFESCVEKDSA